MDKKLLTKISAISIITISAVFLSGLILSMNKMSSFELNNVGQRLEHSVYNRYENQIYANIPSSGYYLIPEADAGSFMLIEDEKDNREPNFAVDKNSAYCGNRIVPNFNAEHVQVLGKHYYSDGKQTVYCAARSKPNRDLSVTNKLIQTWLYGWSLSEKPQEDYYPLEQLPLSTLPYQSLLNADLITNSQQVFYEGRLMPDANPAQLEPISVLRNNNDNYQSYYFYQDGQHVYYKENLLPLESKASLYSFYLDGLSQESYLFDPELGYAAINAHVFPISFAPYQLISRYGAHVNHVLFLSKEGVYFYDKKQDKIARAGDNPFLKGNWQEIAPLIFIYENKTYYLQDEESWGGRKSPGLISRSTVFYRLDENNTEEWEKIGDVSQRRYGEVWRKGQQYYYFDNLGSAQLLKHTIYKITEKQTLTRLLNDKLQVNDIRQMEKNKQLQPVTGTEILRAKTQYKSSITQKIENLISN